MMNISKREGEIKRKKMEQQLENVFRRQYIKKNLPAGCRRMHMEVS